MSECLSPAIEDRLDRLEREMCRWKKLATAALACLSLTVLLGAVANVAEEVKAKRFVLVGQDGQPRGGLSVDTDGIAALRLFDQDGLPRALLSVTANGSPTLSLVEQGRPRVMLNLGPGLVVYDKGGLPRATLGVTPAGAPTLTLTDLQGQVIWSAP